MDPARSEARKLVALLARQGRARVIAGQRAFGIRPRTRHLGVPVTLLARLARPHRRNHRLALALWETRVHEARILAAWVDDPRRVSKAQMERWARDFDSWDVCDQTCGHLFVFTPHAIAMALRWSRARPEFTRRAGFALMAALAVHAKDLPDTAFLPFLKAVLASARDDRPYVRKAVNWALRQIGKRNPRLRRRAVATARLVAAIPHSGARWIASDALRELR
jgi:3-methyladenine DNA glycosylase AlkD